MKGLEGKFEANVGDLVVLNRETSGRTTRVAGFVHKITHEAVRLGYHRPEDIPVKLSHFLFPGNRWDELKDYNAYEVKN
jgi:hypothetical protein